MIRLLARGLSCLTAGFLLIAMAAPVDPAAASSNSELSPKFPPSPALRAHATGSPQWTTSGPFVDDATALAVSPNFDSDHTVFVGVSVLVNPGTLPTAVALIERSTDGGTTWSLIWQSQTPQGNTQQTLNQIVLSPNFATDHTLFAVWAGPNGGGVIRSTDGGASFVPLNVGSTNFSATTKTLSISPNFGTDRTIAVTADATNSTTSYLSTDGGSNWQLITPTGTDSCNDALQGGGFLLALGGNSVGSYIPRASAVCSNNSDQMYTVSHDNGAHWTSGGDIQAALGGANNFDTQHSRMVASGSSILYTDQYGNAIVSASGGATWTNVLGPVLGTDAPSGSASATGPYYRFELASASSVYAVHEWTKLSSPHIFHSSNGGQSWSVLWQGTGASAQHDVTQAGAHTLFMAAGNQGILRSSDLGQTWQTVGEFPGLASAVALSPNFGTDNKLFSVTSPGNLALAGQDPRSFGIYRSSNGGASWAEPEAPNPVQNAQFGDIFTTSSQGGLSLVVSPNFANDQTVFEGDRIGAIAVSHDGGRTWTSSFPGTPPQSGWFVNAMAVSPNYAQDHVVYWGGGPGGFGLFKSVDGAQSWVQVTPADRINEISADQVEALAISPEPSGTLDMAIGLSSRLFLAQDNPSGTARQEWTDGNFLDVGAVAMSPQYQSDCTIYASMWPGPTGIAATLDDGVYVSHNACFNEAQAGAPTWTRLTGNIQAGGNQVRDFDSIALSPSFPTDHTLFISSYSSGVWMSSDAGQTWSSLNAGLANPTVPRIYKLAVAATGPQAGILFAASDAAVLQTPVSLSPSPLAAPITTLAAPVRMVDTRSSGGAIASGNSRCFPMAGQNGIPSDASGVLLNVAAVQYGAQGWLTLYPSGHTVPGTSTLNFDPGEYAIANGTIVGLGSDGKVCVNVGSVGNVAGSSQVVLDATGYVTGPGQSTVALLSQPQRLVDTRSSSGAIPTGNTRCFIVAGMGGIPSDASGVVLNVAAVGYAQQGWLTLFPNGQNVPTTSTLNFDPSEYAIANGTIVKIGTGGQVCVNVGTVGNGATGSQVILDATGYISNLGQAAVSLLPQPQRLVDTRTAGGAINAGTSSCFAVGGLVGIPANATGVILNVAAVQYATPGWLTVFPGSQSMPPTSTLNFDPHDYAIANGTIAGIGPNGQVCVNVGTVGNLPGSSQVIFDVVGFLRP